MKIIGTLVFILFIVFMVTNFFIPLFTGGRLFPTFRGSGKRVVSGETDELMSKVEVAKESVKQVKVVQEEVREYHEKVSEIKKESDELLKN